MATIPHSRPRLGVLVDGPATAELERRWCELTGMEAAACVGSGLAALRLALIALGVKQGDEVIVPAYSCVALLNAPLAIGATPVLADVLPDVWTLDPADVQRRLTPDTKAIIAVNLFGVQAEVPELQKLGVPVIEDCAHGPILGRSRLSVSSFYATKLIGAGMGGIVAGAGEDVAEVRRRCDYGDQQPDGLNLNDRMTERAAENAIAELFFNAAEGIPERERLAKRYSSLLAGSPLRPESSPRARVWFRYVVRLVDPARVAERMRAEGINAERPVWDLRGCRYWRADLPVASWAFDTLLSLPLYPGLTQSDQEEVIGALRRAAFA